MIISKLTTQKEKASLHSKPTASQRNYLLILVESSQRSSRMVDRTESETFEAKDQNRKYNTPAKRNSKKNAGPDNFPGKETRF